MTFLNPLFLISLALFLTETQSDHAQGHPPPTAMQFRLTRDGIDLITQAALAILPQMVLNTAIPDTGLSISYTNINLKNMAVRNFSKPTINYNLIAPNRIVFDVSTGPIDVTADWYAEKPTFWSTQKDQGKFRLHMDDFKTNLVADLGDNFDNGMPSLSSPSCTGTMGKANINIRNATKQFFIDIMQTFSLVFKQVFQSQVCSYSKTMLINPINQQLQMIPDSFNVHPQAGFKYWMQPLITPDYIEISIKAALKTYPPATTITPANVATDASANEAVITTNGPNGAGPRAG